MIFQFSQVLLLRDDVSHKIGRALWTGFQEIDLFYNHDIQRAEFHRFYISQTQPLSTLETILGLRKDVTWKALPDGFWEQSRGKFARTYDQHKLGDQVKGLLPEELKGAFQVIVTDQEITPPKDWRYIISDSIHNGAVASILPTDPTYWREDEPDRVGVIKHRIRTVCLGCVGELMGLENCDNERCFLYNNVDSVLRLDDMVYLGEEHDLPRLARRGFAIHSADPNKIQNIIENPKSGVPA